jgi:hypothetical protein
MPASDDDSCLLVAEVAGLRLSHRRSCMAHWSRDEVEATVSDYFAVLRKELAAGTYSKASHNAHLRELQHELL